MKPTTHRKRLMLPGRMSKIDSTLAQVEGIIAEMRHDADSSGQHYQHTAALKQARPLVEPPLALSTYNRYRSLSSLPHFGKARSQRVTYPVGLEKVGDKRVKVEKE